MVQNEPLLFYFYDLIQYKSSSLDLIKFPIYFYLTFTEFYGIIRLSDEENIEVVDIMNEYLAQRKLMFSDNGAKENEDSKKLYNVYSKKLSDYLSTLKDKWKEKL